MNVLVLNGPNLGKLGTREPEIYGHQTLADIEAGLESVAADVAATLEWFQSNHEGALIDQLEARADWADGALLNAGALTHYSYALADAVRAFAKPVVEVHLSDVQAREPWRRESVLADACVEAVSGLGADSYRVALLALAGRLDGGG
ncbi:MAG: 3-dehydroquinate dehydratase [Gemmatimonadetes bacterium]|nr:3-dehydroquinate dehydratase [Gemmatimonadota bacterium]